MGVDFVVVDGWRLVSSSCCLGGFRAFICLDRRLWLLLGVMMKMCLMRIDDVDCF
ncbi:hypothetical protein Lalb_Chr21g0314261 [Lupinus albus]|uniref:Uncharacterized protein n=1 Tax=Lupinus albus TaxID=3870 RepID=A0A6A4NM57_LUPAL|nr:hypothetical protein Lalb_Chr21g0314261 [Lupinus albus]